MTKHFFQDRPPNGHAYFWNHRVLYAAQGMVAEFHRHYAVSIAITLGEPLFIETETSSDNYFAAIVPQNLFHKANSPGTKMILLLIDPESAECQSVAPFIQANKISKLDPALFFPLQKKFSDLLSGKLNCKEAWELHNEILFTISGIKPVKFNPDERILSITGKLRSELPENIRVGDLAKEVALSSDRLMRLFKEQLGLPIRRYLLWLRILESVKHLKNNSNLTEAAHAAGFSDSAHMSRTFKENFGIQPSFFFGENRLVDIHFCDI
ncbi:MAG: AraC family transcriptional regulator [Leptospira sp.]|nr:AraC family transcriptional regulator [Leptospira sp.]